MLEGWVCPKCGKVLAPWMSECSCSINKTITCETITNMPMDENKQKIMDCLNKINKMEGDFDSWLEQMNWNKTQN